MSKSFLHILVILSVSVILASCGSSRKHVAAPAYDRSDPSSLSQAEISGQSLSPLSEALVAEARRWLGTPYKYGGNDARGIDCSGLVLQVYQRALSIDLPRNSRAQHDFCSPLSDAGLVPGDLLFFATGKDRGRVSHVGIYVGGNNMIHASASKGVIVSDFTAPYYQRTFAGARCVDRYHAMLAPAAKAPKAPQKPKSPKRPEPTEAPKAPVPAPEPAPVHMTATAEPMPVAVSAEPAVAAGEPSPDDARRAVLGSLTEVPINQ